MNHKRKIILDFNIEFPTNFTPEQIALIIRDYIHLNRFVTGTAEVSIYPINVKIVQQALSLAPNLNDIKQ